MTRKKSSAVSGKEEKTQLHSVAMKKQHFIQGQGRNCTSFMGKEETALHSGTRNKTALHSGTRNKTALHSRARKKKICSQ